MNKTFEKGNAFSILTGGYVYENVLPVEPSGDSFETIVPTIVVSNLLVANGYGVFKSLTSDWGIFISEQPDSPDQCITIYDSSGSNLGKGMSGDTLIRPGIQIRIRSKTYPDGIRKIGVINSYLDNISRSPIYSGPSVIGYVQNITRLQDFLPLGRDQVRRFMFSCNYILTIVRT